jgi:P-type Ca2+ transporter type 2C
MTEHVSSRTRLAVDERSTAAAAAPPSLRGLSEAEAQRRFLEEGPNEIPQARKRGLGVIALEVVREPMFLMLVAAGALYLSMGEPIDASLLLGFVCVVMSITIIQERRTERALEALRDLSSPRALVIRDGGQKRIAGREVVRGDIVVVCEGDRVPADALLRKSANLSVDESLLTGESVPVRKSAAPGAAVLDQPGGDDLPSLFSGTLITTGQGHAEVAAIGAQTQLGRIGKAMQSLEPEPTLLQKETGRLVRALAVVGLSLCALVVLAYGLTRGGTVDAWKQGLLVGIALAMATLPEELPVVLTVFLALGAWRISRHRVLTRRMPAIETLGAATVLCVDKTGTLTLNQMTTAVLEIPGTRFDLRTDEAQIPPGCAQLLETAVLASKPDPFDPMERAIHTAGSRFLTGAHRPRPDLALDREYPLSAQLLVLANAWSIPGTAGLTIAAKGAPEAIAELCRLPADRRETLTRQVTELAGEGLRVLGVARGAVLAHALPADLHEMPLEFVGLLALEDPLREAVPAAVKECRAAGIRVVMITGDYPATARSIARQAGIECSGAIMTGPEIDAMDDEEFVRRAPAVTVFARVVPEQKLRIVQALKASHEVVAMTGDGVNDAPALKAAHIGVAMGERGTDVAREAASLVLLDDSFPAIVAAVRLGRRIFDNIKKAVVYIFAVHVPIAGLSIVPVLFGDWPILLLPVHIVFLELVIDPACSLIFEAEEAEADVMKRPPRGTRERLISPSQTGVALLQGISTLAACLIVFFVAMRGGTSADPRVTENTARAATFVTLVIGNLLLILTNRSWTASLWRTLRTPNPASRWVVGGTLIVLALVLWVPSLQALFHFARPSLSLLGLSMGLGFSCVLWFEVLKMVRRWRRSHPFAIRRA